MMDLRRASFASGNPGRLPEVTFELLLKGQTGILQVEEENNYY